MLPVLASCFLLSNEIKGYKRVGCVSHAVFERDGSQHAENSKVEKWKVSRCLMISLCPCS